MNNEIKEILEYIENNTQSETIYMLKLDTNEAKILLDYITNLQEENERLIISLSAQEELTMNEYYKKNIYKSRIDKAIEYCNLYTRLSAKDLLNILQGEDKE